MALLRLSQCDVEPTLAKWHAEWDLDPSPEPLGLLLREVVCRTTNELLELPAASARVVQSSDEVVIEASHV